MSAQDSTPTSAPFGALGTSKSALLVGGIIAAILLAGGGFAAGMQYQKQHPSGVSTAAAGGAGGRTGGGRFGRGGGGFGSVSAISATSITISNPRSGTDTTYTINSSTQILNQGAAGSISDIASGDSVVVVPDSSDPKIAARIMLGGFGGGGGLQSN
jgi:hypothetical protein